MGWPPQPPRPSSGSADGPRHGRSCRLRPGRSRSERGGRTKKRLLALGERPTSHTKSDHLSMETKSTFILTLCNSSFNSLVPCSCLRIHVPGLAGPEVERVAVLECSHDLIVICRLFFLPAAKPTGHSTVWVVVVVGDYFKVMNSKSRWTFFCPSEPLVETVQWTVFPPQFLFRVGSCTPW